MVGWVRRSGSPATSLAHAPPAQGRAASMPHGKLEVESEVRTLEHAHGGRGYSLRAATHGRRFACKACGPGGQISTCMRFGGVGRLPLPDLGDPGFAIDRGIVVKHLDPLQVVRLPCTTLCAVNAVSCHAAMGQRAHLHPCCRLSLHSQPQLCERQVSKSRCNLP